MSLGHLDEVQPFKPQGSGGGSKKGKPQGEWPWILKIVGDAIIISVKGSSDAYLADRRCRITTKEFAERLEHFLPGWRSWAVAALGPRATPYEELLKNRIYKMYYSGTSDRGCNHDPKTRAAISREHWTHHFARTSELGQLHESITRGRINPIQSWEQYL